MFSNLLQEPSSLREQHIAMRHTSGSHDLQPFSLLQHLACQNDETHKAAACAAEPAIFARPEQPEPFPDSPQLPVGPAQQQVPHQVREDLKRRMEATEGGRSSQEQATPSRAPAPSPGANIIMLQKCIVTCGRADSQLTPSRLCASSGLPNNSRLNASPSTIRVLKDTFLVPFT